MYRHPPAYTQPPPVEPMALIDGENDGGGAYRGDDDNVAVVHGRRHRRRSGVPRYTPITGKRQHDQVSRNSQPQHQQQREPSQSGGGGGHEQFPIRSDDSGDWHWRARATTTATSTSSSLYRDGSDPCGIPPPQAQAPRLPGQLGPAGSIGQTGTGQFGPQVAPPLTAPTQACYPLIVPAPAPAPPPPALQPGATSAFDKQSLPLPQSCSSFYKYNHYQQPSPPQALCSCAACTCINNNNNNTAFSSLNWRPDEIPPSSSPVTHQFQQQPPSVAYQPPPLHNDQTTTPYYYSSDYYYYPYYNMSSTTAAASVGTYHHQPLMSPRLNKDRRNHNDQAPPQAQAPAQAQAQPQPPQSGTNGFGVYTPNQTPRKLRRRNSKPWEGGEGAPSGCVEVIVISSDDEEEPRVEWMEKPPAYHSRSYSRSMTGQKRVQQMSSVSSTDNNANVEEEMNEEHARKRRKRRQPPAPKYVPPRRPIHKPGDVKVKKVSDNFRPREAYDDDEGHYIICANSDFTNRYRITKLLGQGTFGKVVAAYDRVAKRECAIKIIRAVEKYREASKIELRVLDTLSRYDENNVNKCIHLRECFDYRNHICIVTDLLGISIYDFMKNNELMAFPGSHVQNFALQLFKSVAFLHDLGLIHTDLKPENILLVDSTFRPTTIYMDDHKRRVRNVLNNTNIHLIDFGSAIFNDEYHSSVVSTRHYRAPEIILGTGWSYPCDVWSIGCILVELVIGDALFQTHDNLEHLALMQKILDKPVDVNMVRRARSMAKDGTIGELFDARNRVSYPSSDTKASSRKYVDKMPALRHILGSAVEGWTSRNKQFWDLFLDLLQKIFVYDPAYRISAQDALQHPWFLTQVCDEGSNAVMSGNDY